MEYLLFGAGVSMLFFATAQLATKNKKPFHYTIIAGCLLVAYVYLYLWAVETGLILRLPALVGSELSATLLFTPAVYLSALTILHEGRRPVRSYAAYFIAPVIFAIGFGIYNGLTAPALLRGLDTAPGYFTGPPPAFFRLAVHLVFAAAVAIDLLAAFRLKRAGRIRNRAGFRHQVVFLFLYLGAALNLVASCLLRDDRHYVIAALIFCPIALAWGATRIAVTYFGAGRVIPLRPRPVRPEWEDSAQDIAQRLDQVMRTSAPHRDGDLTLGRLARMVGIEPERLSYHLHTSLSTNFRTYINGWRLESVSRELLKYPERSILDTAMENGFSSKSSFNTLFYKKYGKTPSEYRRENGVSG